MQERRSPGSARTMVSSTASAMSPQPPRRRRSAARSSRRSSAPARAGTATRRWGRCRARDGLAAPGAVRSGADHAHLARHAVDDDVDEAAPDGAPREREDAQGAEGEVELGERHRRCAEGPGRASKRSEGSKGARSRVTPAKSGLSAPAGESAMLLPIHADHPEPRKIRRAVDALEDGRGHRVPHRHGLRAGVRPDEQARHRPPLFHQGDGPVAPAGLRLPRPVGHREVRHRRKPGLPRAAPLPARAVHLHPAGHAGRSQARAEQAQASRHPRAGVRGHPGPGPRARPPHHLEHGGAPGRGADARPPRDRRRLQGPGSRARRRGGGLGAHERDRPDESPPEIVREGAGPVDEFR